MNLQEKMDAVDRAEKLLLETDDTIHDVIHAVVTDDLAEKYGRYNLRKVIQKAFHQKHDCGMAVWRQKQTGHSNPYYVKLNTERRLAAGIARAKKLLINTEFHVYTLCQLACVNAGQLARALKQEGHTSKTYRRAHRPNTNVYLSQPVRRTRKWINGGMSIQVRDRDPISYATLRLEDTIGKAVLSVAVVGLSFTVSEFVDGKIVDERLELKETLLIKTGFTMATPDVDTQSETFMVPCSLLSGGSVKVNAIYDLQNHRLQLRFAEYLIPRHISFTLMVTETNL